MKKIIVLFCFLVLAFGTKAQEKQNVLFIAVDDLKPILGTYGNDNVYSPNLDKLASRGVVFGNNHTQQAVCGPSRASLLTGLRPDVTEVHDLKTLIRDKNPDIVTLPQFFKNNGYESVGMGKIFDPRSVDKGLDEVSWSRPFIMPEVNHPEKGKDSFNYQSESNKAEFEKLKKLGEQQGLSGAQLNAFIRSSYKPSTESIDISDDGYFDGALAVEAVDMLGKLSNGDNPFFLAVGFKKPHLPFIAPQKYWDLYDRDDFDLAAFQQHAANTPELPYHNSGELNSYTDIPEEMQANGLLNEDKQRELIHGYYACISYIDEQIGKILNELDRLGLRESTTIVVWGDHGWHLGDHGLWNKHSNFEQATRSPLIFAGPGIKQNQYIDSPTEFVDVFPTLTDLNGMTAPAYLQGESLKPILYGEEKRIKDFAISQFHRGPHMGYALRNDRYRYVVWYNQGDTQNPTILLKELYDYRKDPLETRNIAANNPKLSNELQKLMDQFLAESNRQKIDYKKLRSSASNVSNLMINGSFESDMEGWESIGKCTIEATNEKASDGSSSIKLSGTRCGVRQQLSGLQPKTAYQLQVDLASDGKKKAIVVIEGAKEDKIRLVQTERSFATFTAKFTTGADVENVLIKFQNYENVEGAVWADNFELSTVDATTASIDQPLKDILPDFYIGAAIAHAQLGTNAEKLLLQHFNYTTAENAAKQSRVHPQPGVWDWKNIDEVVEMAHKNGLAFRLHGPISPQSSPWAKDDARTAEELWPIMEDYLTEECKRFNGHPAVKWMDVVNETVTPEGEWFGPKPGNTSWENPWTILGHDDDKNKTPSYIRRAFEIANEHAPDISLVYNHHGGMQPVMWEKVKETILYLKSLGLRVDGMGWQGHLKTEEPLAFDEEQLTYLSDLISWAHENDLDFHITEFDYKITDGLSEASLKRQADAYANIMKVLLSKRSSGVVTWNSWGIEDGRGLHADKYMWLFAENGEPKPAFYALKKVLEAPEAPLGMQQAVFSDDLIEEKVEFRTMFGKQKPTIISDQQTGGVRSILLSADKTGVKYTLTDLKPNMNYTFRFQIIATDGVKPVAKVEGEVVDDMRVPIKNKGKAERNAVSFTTNDKGNSVNLIINRWDGKTTGKVFINNIMVYADN